LISSPLIFFTISALRQRCYSRGAQRGAARREAAPLRRWRGSGSAQTRASDRWRLLYERRYLPAVAAMRVLRQIYCHIIHDIFFSSFQRYFGCRHCSLDYAELFAFMTFHYFEELALSIRLIFSFRLSPLADE
jgi:hypothetical protein